MLEPEAGSERMMEDMKTGGRPAFTIGVELLAGYGRFVWGRVTRVRRVRELPPLMIVGSVILLAYVVVAITATWWAPYGETEIGTGAPFEGMSAKHWFGTDGLGRDIFSRTVIATRIEFQLATLGTLLGFAIGGTLGLAAALVGGIFDEVVMRVGEGIISLFMPDE